MPVSFYRYQKSKIFISDYIDHIDAAEFRDSLQVALKQLDRAVAPLSFIADWRRAANYPISYDMITFISRVVRHPNMGKIVVLGMNPTLEFWGKLFTSLIGLHYDTANTVQEALTLLEPYLEAHEEQAAASHGS